MSSFAPRRAPWIGGAALLAAALAVSATVGSALGLRSWTVYLGIALAALLLMGWAERTWEQRSRRVATPAARGRLKVIRGGRYDLEKDDSTDSQRYLM